MKKHAQHKRGFALIIAVIFTSVVVSIATVLLGIAYKQLVLASTARQSQYAFYNADGGLECAQYWDSNDTFDYYSEPASGSLTCQSQSITYSMTIHGAAHWTTFSIPCSGGTNADVTVVKTAPSGGISTYIYSNGYNTCTTSDPRRIQRGEEVQY